jgi:serine/threonine protein phosphatase PrpC
MKELSQLIDKIEKASMGGAKARALKTDECDTIKKAIVNGFLSLDEAMRAELRGGVSNGGGTNEPDRSGTTAVCALVTHSHYFIINLGDSRAILSKSKSVAQDMFVTEDHKPYLPKERERITAAGGSVMIQRVNGSLAVSRALGDYEYKSVHNLPATAQLVSPEPDVYVLSRDEVSSASSVFFYLLKKMFLDS